MQNILAIESSTQHATVALASGQAVYAEILSGVQTHSEALIPMVQTLLNQAKIRTSDLHGLVLGCGPGAFTGVRTACGLIQGMAYSLNIPIALVNSFESMAQAVWLDKSHLAPAWQSQECVCLLDARMNEVYWAHLRRNDDTGNWDILREPCLSRLEDVLTYAQYAEQQKAWWIVDPLLQAVFNPLKLEMSLKGVFMLPQAQATIVLGKQILEKGMGVIPEQAQPLYLRDKVALTTQERHAQKSVHP